MTQPHRSSITALLALLCCGLILFFLAGRKKEDESQAINRFIDEQVCMECHQKEYYEWQGSHHDLAMQKADERTVLGDFNESFFTYFGLTSRFFKKENKFFINTEGPDGKLADFEIKYTFGVEPLQQYLIEFKGGRLQCLTIAWDTERKRWFHLYPSEKHSADDPLHWTGIYQNWNNMCAYCHSTDLRKNFDFRTNSYQTEWAQIDVGCQACHGPGETHVAWAQTEDKEAAKPSGGKHLIVDMKNNSARQLDACAPCHSRRSQLSDRISSGAPLLNNFLPAVLSQGLYHVDGQILDEVYVYGSFLQSRMYQTGVACSDCHNPHTLKLVQEGNGVCVQCHQQFPREKFETLELKNYDSPEHHFHQPDSEGAQCVNCHMPAQTYMVVDSRRDHSFRVPRPDLSVKLGTPDACTMCHEDKTVQWAASVVADWNGPKVSEGEHYAEVLAVGRSGQPAALNKLMNLASDSLQPTVVRASALELMRHYSSERIEKSLLEATRNRNPLVRATAAGGLNRMPPQDGVKYMLPLLSDSVLAVRLAATRLLIQVPLYELAPAEKVRLKAAIDEFKAVQYAMADQPGAHLNLAVFYESQDKLDSAEVHYRNAVKMDPYFLPARINIVNLYNRTRRNNLAERELRQAIELVPHEGELYYSLGLLLAEEQRLDEAVEPLATAVELSPGDARKRYNYGLTLHHLGKRREAEIMYLKAHETAPGDPDIVNALAVFFIQEQRWYRALTYAEKLVQLLPQAPGPQQMVKQLHQHLKRFEEKDSSS